VGAGRLIAAGDGRAFSGLLPPRKGPVSGVRERSGTDVGFDHSPEKGPIVIRFQYPMRRRFLILPAVLLALCLGVSSAIAEPLDQAPSTKPPATANVYVPPPELFAAPGGPTTTSPLPRPASAGTGSDSDPWLAIGLAAGGVVLLCGCAVGFRRTRQRRHVA
jgi:hypothetical protein